MSLSESRVWWMLVAALLVGATVAAPPARGSFATSLGPAAEPSPTPDEDGWIRYAPDLVDYAPAGMPDFDQRQSRWYVESVGRTRWTHDGPVALAGALWWLDSDLEPAGEAPPARADGYPLLDAYGPWDDHAPENVRPLVADLAARANTNRRSEVIATGTCLEDLVQGATSYLGRLEGPASLAARPLDMPTLEELAVAVGSGRPTVLLLGLWQHHPAADWQRIGGHYVTLEAVDRTIGRVRVSDPYRDLAAPAEGTTAHNDAAALSHDAWLVSPSLRPGTPLVLDSYLDEGDELVSILANFQGLNGRTCAGGDAPWIDGARLEAQIEAALVIEPRAPTPTQTARTSPSPTVQDKSPSPTAVGTAETPTPTSTATATQEPTPTATRTSTATATPEPTAAAPTQAAATATVESLSSPSPSATPVPPDPTPTVAPSPHPTDGVSHVCGRVADRDRGTPVARAEVWLLLDSEPIAFTRTGSDGTFCFRDLPPGRYEVRVKAPGCAPAGAIVTAQGGTVGADLAVVCRTEKVFLPVALTHGGRRR